MKITDKEYYEYVKQAKLKEMNEYVTSSEIVLNFEERVFAALERNVGKKITRRIVDKIKEFFPNYNVSYDKSESICSIDIWGNGVIDFYKRVRIVLGRDVVNLDEYRFLNPWVDRLKENVIKTKKEIENFDQIMKRFEELNTKREALKKEFEDAAAALCMSSSLFKFN